MKIQAQVIEAGTKTSKVRLLESAGCSGSCSFGSCAPLLNMWPFKNKRTSYISIDSDQNKFEEGQLIELELKEDLLRKQAFLAYLLPVIIFIFGAWFGQYLGEMLNVTHDLLAFVFGVGVTFIYLYFFGIFFAAPQLQLHQNNSQTIPDGGIIKP
ncbi:MAG: SoxR reducing system RseC family protein [bacterium]